MKDRVDIIVEGIKKHKSVEDVNNELKDNQKDVLYARSFWESCIIYTLNNGLNGNDFIEIKNKYQDVVDEAYNQNMKYFEDGAITFKKIEDYVVENSDTSNNLQTMFITNEMALELENVHNEKDFKTYIEKNKNKFSMVRERTRYYFCKYLYFYLKQQIDEYLKKYMDLLDSDMVKSGLYKDKIKSLLEEESGFITFITDADRTRLKKINSYGGHMDYLQNQVKISESILFREFNYFYSEYITLDWLAMVFEMYDNPESWTDARIIKVGHKLKLCKKNPDEAEIKKTLEELIGKWNEYDVGLDEQYRRDDIEAVRKSYQKGRSGNNFFRDFFKGDRDISRSTFLAFMLFIGGTTKLSDKDKINIQRLNVMLQNCQFQPLNPRNPYDKFIVGYLNATDRLEYLYDEMEKSADALEKSVLYKLYTDSYSHERELENKLENSIQ